MEPNFFEEPDYPGVNWGCIGFMAVLLIGWIGFLALVVWWVS